MKNYIRKAVQVTDTDGTVKYIDHWKKFTLTDNIEDAHTWVFEKTVQKFVGLIAEKYPDAQVTAVTKDTPAPAETTETVEETTDTTEDITPMTDVVEEIPAEVTETVEETTEDADFEDLEDFEFEE